MKQSERFPQLSEPPAGRRAPLLYKINHRYFSLNVSELCVLHWSLVSAVLRDEGLTPPDEGSVDAGKIGFTRHVRKRLALKGENIDTCM